MRPAVRTRKAEQPSRPRTRRSTREVIDRITDAAIEEFREKGFAEARTAEIAQRAGVVEALLFNHFGSKVGVFQQAIFTYLDRHFTQFSEDHPFEPDGAESRRKVSREYIEAQQDFLHRDSRLFRSLFARESLEDGKAQSGDERGGMQGYLDKMVGIVEARAGDTPEADAQLIARISFATVLACTLYRDLLFPPEIADEAKIREAVADFVMLGAYSSI